VVPGFVLMTSTPGIMRRKSININSVNIESKEDSKEEARH
jgi:hypothetical protein